MKKLKSVKFRFWGKKVVKQQAWDSKLGPDSIACDLYKIALRKATQQLIPN